MSELTRCNYCTLKILERDAKKYGTVITKLKGWRGGTDVFMHPENVDIETLSREERDKYFCVWLMEISTHCVC